MRESKSMPLIIRITAEDLAGWDLTHKVGPSFGMGKMQTYHYRPRLAGELEQYAERIQVVANWDLNEWIGKDMVCFINIDKGWMSRDLGVRPEVKFQLKSPNEPIRDPRRLRLKIKAIDTSTRPPRVTLEDFTANIPTLGDYQRAAADVLRVGHSHDSECTIDPTNDCCLDCGVHHGEPCPDCGMRAFHTLSCPVFQRKIGGKG